MLFVVITNFIGEVVKMCHEIEKILEVELCYEIEKILGPLGKLSKNLVE